MVDRAVAASRAPLNLEMCHPPSPANTTALAGSGGTYTVTWRPPSYSNVSVTNCPAVGDIGPVGGTGVADSVVLVGVRTMLGADELDFESRQATSRT